MKCIQRYSASILCTFSVVNNEHLQIKVRHIQFTDTLIVNKTLFKKSLKAIKTYKFKNIIEKNVCKRDDESKLCGLTKKLCISSRIYMMVMSNSF